MTRNNVPENTKGEGEPTKKYFSSCNVTVLCLIKDKPNLNAS